MKLEGAKKPASKAIAAMVLPEPRAGDRRIDGGSDDRLIRQADHGHFDADPLGIGQRELPPGKVPRDEVVDECQPFTFRNFIRGEAKHAAPFRLP